MAKDGKPRIQNAKSATPQAFKCCCPSATLLTLLAAISPATTSASPLDFLHPQSPTSHPKAKHRPRWGVPAKFVEGDDGKWRPVELAELHGYIISPSCQNVAVSTSGVSHSSLASTDFPLGWRQMDTRVKDNTTLILALSLCLAFAIIFCMIGCVVFRKTRRKSRHSDVEVIAARRKRKRKRTEQEQALEKTRRIWARASARWREDARRSARHRRGPRPHSIRSLSTNPSRNRSRTRSLCSSYTQSIASSAPMRSRNSSVSSNVTQSTPPPHSLPNPRPELQPHPQRQQPSLNSPSNTPRNSISPPAYRPSQLLTAGPKAGQPSAELSPISPCAESSPNDPNSSSVSSGHVATDDKSRLAQLATLASEAPDSSPTGQVLSSSAPEWPHADIPSEQVDCEAGPSGIPIDPPRSDNFLPPPPEKQIHTIDALSAVDYELETLHLVPSIDDGGDHLQASAPPFVEDDGFESERSMLVASAPMLVEDDDDRLLDMDAHSSDSPTSAHPYAQNHDRQPPQHTPELPEYSS